MNIVDKVSKFNRAQNTTADGNKQQTATPASDFAAVRKSLPSDVKSKLFELHQKYGGMKEATIYNLMKKHEFKYNLVENDLKMLVISKRNFSAQEQPPVSASVEKKRSTQQGGYRDSRDTRDAYDKQAYNSSYRHNKAPRNDDRAKPEDTRGEYASDAQKHKSRYSDAPKGYGGDKYNKPYAGSGYNQGYKRQSYQSGYTSGYNNGRGGRQQQRGRDYDYVKRGGDAKADEHDDSLYVQKDAAPVDALETPHGVLNENTEVLVNEEEDEVSEERGEEPKLGLFAEPRKSVDANDSKRALDKLITLIENNLIYYFSILKEAPEQHKAADNLGGEKVEHAVHQSSRTPADSKYKKKQLDIVKEFKNDIHESSTHARANKVDLHINKKFESEEEKLKSTRERKLEKKVNDMAEIINTMQLRINALENVLRSKDGVASEPAGAFQSNMYCMVPFHLVKGLLTPVDGNGAPSELNGQFKCFTLNHDS